MQFSILVTNSKVEYFEFNLQKLRKLNALYCILLMFMEHNCDCIVVFVDEIAKLFPGLYGQPSSIMVPRDSEGLSSNQKLKIGVVLSGGQAPGGHNVICGIFGLWFTFSNLFITLILFIGIF